MMGLADKGMGVDRMRNSDARKMPKEGRQMMIDLLNACEHKVAWPWQILLSVVRLEHKETGDRALALLPWIARTWQLLRRPAVDKWCEGTTEQWDAALKGNSCLREALGRMLRDECINEAGAFAATFLADIKRFYDSLCPLKVLTAALEMGFPIHILMMETLLHIGARVLKQKNTYGTILQVTKSMLAGSRIINQLARCVTHRILHKVHWAVPSSVKRAWFDDIGIQITGSKTW